MDALAIMIIKMKLKMALDSIKSINLTIFSKDFIF